MKTETHLPQCFRLIKLVFFLLVFVLLAGCVINGFFYPRHVEPLSGSILSSNDSLQVTTSEGRDFRLKFLADIALQQQATKAEYYLARESERMQARLSFVGLIAALLVALLSEKDSEKLFSNRASGIVLIAFILFLGFYFFDIHTADLSERTIYNKSRIDSTVKELVEVGPADFTWYELFESNKETQALADSLRDNSFSRKMMRSFRPASSQTVFYFLPILVVIGLGMISEFKSYRNKKQLAES